MKNMSVQINVLFEKGMIITANPIGVDPLERIGEILLKINKITNNQLKQAAQNQRQTKEKKGIILFNMGAVTKDDLIKILNMQVKELVFSLFQWSEGGYSFKPGDISYDRNYWSPINTEFILMEGVRRVDEWPILERKIPSMAIVFAKLNENTAKIKEVKEEDESLDDMFGEEKSEELDNKDSEDGIELTKQEIATYELVDGKHDVQHIIDTGLIGAFETCSSLSNLMAAGLIRQASGPKIKISAAPAVKVTTKVRSTIFSLRNLLSAAISIGSVLILGMAILNTGGTLKKGLELASFYNQSLSKNRLNSLGQNIHVLQYKNNLTPRELNDLLNKDSVAKTLLIERWGEGIRIEINNTGKVMVLKSRP